jgi:hypothetical protein
MQGICLWLNTGKISYTYVVSDGKRVANQPRHYRWKRRDHVYTSDCLAAQNG